MITIWLTFMHEMQLYVSMHLMTMSSNRVRTFDISQATTEGSLETRSNEKTLFFTFLARRASPVIQFEGKKRDK